MQEIILVIHLILTISLVVLILIQRSSGGALGMGGGGGQGGGMMSGRSAATLLTKITTFLAVGFFVTSIGLAIVAKQQSENMSVFDGSEKIVEKNLPEEPAKPAKAEPVIPESE